MNAIFFAIITFCGAFIGGHIGASYSPDDDPPPAQVKPLPMQWEA